MKKRLEILFIALIILNIVFYNIAYASSIVVTKAGLSDAFKNIEQLIKQQNTSQNVTFNVKDTEIEVLENGNSFAVMKYDLTNKPVFTVDMTITSNMTYEEFNEEVEKSGLALYGFIAVANIAGVNETDTMAYYIVKAFEQLSNINISNSVMIDLNNFNAIEYAKTYYSNSYPQNDEFFTTSTSILTETVDEVVARSTITINTDADFSKLDGYAEKMNSNIDNSINNNANNIDINSNIINNNKQNTLDTNNTNNTQNTTNTPYTQKNTINTNISNTNTLPKAGIEDGVLIIAIAVGIMSFGAYFFKRKYEIY